MPTYPSLQDFAQDIARKTAADLRAIQEGVAEGLADAALPIAQEIAPVKTGALRRSLRRVNEDSEKKVVSDAAHGAIIDRGRKRSTKVMGREKRRRGKAAPSVKGKMLGSKDAPRGISGPTGRRTRKMADQIAAKVIADVEARNR